MKQTKQPSRVNEVNTRRTLQQIWLSGGTSRVALAEELGLVKSTVSRIVGSLIEQGIVRESAHEDDRAGVGRKPVRVEINERYGLIVGLEIQADFYTAAAIDLNGALRHRWSGSISMAGKDLETAFLEIMREIDPWLREAGVPLIGVGVGVPGIVDQYRGVILQSNPLNVTEPEHFTKRLRERFPVPVILENDANCCCWGELVVRKSARHRNFLFVLGEFRTGEKEHDLYWGIAVGLGLVLQGAVYHGASYSAGEFQSILWEPGNEGQLSIANEEARRIREDETVMRAALEELSAHVAFLVNTLNLTGVVFGGEIAEYRELLEPILEAEIQKNWSYESRVECTIDFSSLNRDAVAYGAAGMFLESVFNVPELFTAWNATRRSEVSVLDTW
ncbi:MAG: ROK family protein [Spirochaetota bacterium]